MSNKEEPSHLIYNYGCLNYSSKSECKICDGFGKNSNINKDMKECYITKNQIKEELGLKNER